MKLTKQFGTNIYNLVYRFVKYLSLINFQKELNIFHHVHGNLHPHRLLNPHRISLGYDVNINAPIRIEAICEYNSAAYNPQIVIGNNVSINENLHIGSINGVHIGNNVAIGSNVVIIDHSHGSMLELDLPPMSRELISKGPIVIEDDVWIGSGSIILGNVTIGQSSIIGANSLVNENIPPYSLAVGSPAFVVKNVE